MTVIATGTGVLLVIVVHELDHLLVRHYLLNWPSDVWIGGRPGGPGRAWTFRVGQVRWRIVLGTGWFESTGWTGPWPETEERMDQASPGLLALCTLGGCIGSLAGGAAGYAIFGPCWGAIVASVCWGSGVLTNLLPGRPGGFATDGRVLAEILGGQTRAWWLVMIGGCALVGVLMIAVVLRGVVWVICGPRP